MSRYYHYCTGRYALVDVFHRNIWLNIHDETLAHEIRSTFISKVNLVVYDLKVFENWSETTVDSDCCLDWKIPITQNENVTAVFLNNQHLLQTCQFHEHKFLINEPIDTLLSQERQFELQEQMMLYKKLLDVSQLHIPIKHSGTWFHNDLVDDAADVARINLLTEIRNIFCSEIYISDIEEKLFDFAEKNIKINLGLCTGILALIDKLYA
jgi:hypothetical protein